MATEKDIMLVVGLIGAAFPNFKPTKQTVEVYAQTLADLDGDLLRQATLQAVASNGRQFAPSVAEIRAEARRLLAIIEKVPTPHQAWEEVCNAMRDVGSYRRPTFSHPLVEQAMNTIGWRELCLSENQVSDRAQFLRAYEDLVARHDYQSTMLPSARAFIEDNGGPALPSPMRAMRLLTDKLAGKK